MAKVSGVILLDNSDKNADWIKSTGAMAEAHDPGTVTFTRNGDKLDVELIRQGVRATLHVAFRPVSPGAYYRTHQGLASNQWVINRDREVFYGLTASGSGSMNWAKFVKVMAEVESCKIQTVDAFWAAMHRYGVNWWSVN